MAEEKNLKNVIQNVRKDFSFLKDEVLAVLIFGSVHEGKAGKKSDVDICIVAPGKDPKSLLRDVFRHVDVVGKGYDVFVFEELPLHIKVEVMNKNTVVFGNVFDLYEYFYKFRKIWNDQKHRQTLTKKEMMEMLK